MKNELLKFPAFDAGKNDFACRQCFSTKQNKLRENVYLQETVFASYLQSD